MRWLGRYISNDGSMVKAAKIQIAEFMKGTPGLSCLIQTYEEDGKAIYTLRGPLRRLGKLECEILR